MKVAVLTGLHELAIVERPTPQVRGDHDVLLRIETVGVCGSDIHYYTTGRIGSQVVQYPYPVGHECAATVLEVGRAVTRVRPGDHVAVDPAINCGQCDQCRKGRPHTCRKLLFLGCPGQIDGCLSEYYVMPEGSLFRIRPETSLERAALVEPLSIGYYAVQQSVPMKGAKVGILGAGPIGLSVLVAARAGGAAEIYVTDPLAYRREAARRNGARWAGDPVHEDVVAAVTRAEPLLLDVVFECCGKQEALDQAVALLGPGGKLMLIGIPEVDRVSFGIDVLRRRELCIQNVRRQNECVQATLDLVESGRANVDFMITHHFPLAKCKEAFDLVDQYADGVIKAMIHC